jgi:hypothetical protein
MEDATDRPTCADDICPRSGKQLTQKINLIHQTKRRK